MFVSLSQCSERRGEWRAYLPLTGLGVDDHHGASHPIRVEDGTFRRGEGHRHCESHQRKG